MKQHLNRFIFILLCYQPMIMANPADDAAPLTINSDTFHFDNQSGVATYTGHVNATQGSRKLTGDTLKIYRDEKSGTLNKIIITGNPANYQGATEQDQPLLYAKAKSIIYTIPTKFLILEGNAEITQNEDTYRAEKIEYDGLKKTVYSPHSDKQQTTIILKGEHNVDF